MTYGEEDFESSNIHLKWLEKIYSNLDNLENIERIAREGCNSLMEYLQVPFNMQRVILADSQYKNLRFFVFELNVLVGNLAPVLKEKSDDYKIKIKQVVNIIDKRNLFLKETKKNMDIISLETTPLFNQTIIYLSELKSGIIKDIGHILYLKEEEQQKKKW